MKQNYIKKVGPYNFIKEIGSGTFARVYLATTDNQTGYFAIKMIQKKQLQPQLLNMIEMEIEILRKLNHQNIIKLIDSKYTQSNIYLIFEYCIHGDLENFVRKNTEQNRVPENEAKKIIKQLASALENLHSLRIIHRDLKLSNILVNEDFNIKLADFGFARFISDDSLVTTFCGTPITMAPEILQKGNYDDKCDIWSVGVIIYQLIYGRPPFIPAKNGGLMDLFEQIVKQELSFPETPIVSNELKDLLRGMLQKNRKLRFNMIQFASHKWITQEIANDVPKNESFLKHLIKDQEIEQISQQSNNQQLSHKISDDINDFQEIIDDNEKGKLSNLRLIICYELVKAANDYLAQLLNRNNSLSNLIKIIGKFVSKNQKINQNILKLSLSLYILQGLKLQQISEFLRQQVVQIRKDSLKTELIILKIKNPFNKFNNLIQQEINQLQFIFQKNKESLNELKASQMSIGDLIFSLTLEILYEITLDPIKLNMESIFYQKLFQLLQDIVVDQPQQREIFLQIRLKNTIEMNMYWQIFKLVKTQHQEIQKQVELIDLRKKQYNESFPNIVFECIQNDFSVEDMVSFSLSDVIELKTSFELSMQNQLMQQF